jgi:hypothetical protein
MITPEEQICSFIAAVMNDRDFGFSEYQQRVVVRVIALVLQIERGLMRWDSEHGALVRCNSERGPLH